jgi:hypothetical protein
MTNEVQWRIWLRAENVAILLIALYLYQSSGASWWTFLLLFLLPDLSMLGYALNKKIGAQLYNMGHSYAAPVAWFGMAQINPLLGEEFAVIWLAHIALDRALGFGLKSTAGFRFTHLGYVGKPAAD